MKGFFTLKLVRECEI